MSVKRLKKVEDILLLQQEKNPVVIDEQKVVYFLYSNSNTNVIQHDLNVVEVRKKYIDTLKKVYKKRGDFTNADLVLEPSEIVKIRV
ncbi:hypothetical protein INF30_06990 [Lachnospiraceae bacterium DSM 108991]|uniref:Uncharacterized protein n=1 Tax=Claveliimonas monacensis TaxID=2779351 RepID=A0ABR9RJ63_9FIRM|nr:hypothetical protein [Claveliimonas monacensis]MBE5063004.1 hypothetical protein [Claveliimonas monacensis]